MEVWRHDGDALQFMRLHKGQYTTTMESILFPGLPAATLSDFVRQGNEHGIIPMVRAFRAWVCANRQL